MFQKNKTQTQLEVEITRLHDEMRSILPIDPDYDTISDQLIKLYAVKDPKSKPTVSPDVLLTAAANIAGIGMIIHHERANVIASKALSFVMKLR